MNLFSADRLFADFDNRILWLKIPAGQFEWFDYSMNVFNTGHCGKGILLLVQ
jgi:hypothetical protein